MNSIAVAEMSAKMAKEIVVAKVQDSKEIPVNKEGGKFIADFYAEIYNGIFEALKPLLVNR
ncbi:MAG: hypothetical protein K2G60_00230 [Oscillospiraceae bacterium]|nr:hypothetical protein [Oscillospiraceae bacterium]